MSSEFNVVSNQVPQQCTRVALMGVRPCLQPCECGLVSLFVVWCVCVCACIYIYICVCVCVRVCVCVCVCACVWSFVCMVDCVRCSVYLFLFYLCTFVVLSVCQVVGCLHLIESAGLIGRKIRESERARERERVWEREGQ